MTKAVDKRDDEHHAWCNRWDEPQAECSLCVSLNEAYPFEPGETAAQATARYFPQDQVIALPEPKPELVMVKRGRPVLQANDEMIEAHAAVRETLDELEIFLREHTVERRIARKADEAARVETVKTTLVKASRRRTERLVLTSDGHTREVKKVKTTANKLEKDGKLTRDLAIYLAAFAQCVADGHGAATDDHHDSSNRLTAAYEPVGTLSGFGSRTYSDRQLTGIEALQEMKNRIPQELVPIFNQIVDEEVVGYSPLKRTLAELGEKLGYKHKQTTAAGGALVYAVTCLIAHYMREKGFYSEKARQTDAA